MADSTIVTKIYEQIPLEGMQQVSDSYMAWYVDRVTRQLDETMSDLRAELRDNDAKRGVVSPLATRARVHRAVAAERCDRRGSA